MISGTREEKIPFGEKCFHINPDKQVYNKDKRCPYWEPIIIANKAHCFCSYLDITDIENPDLWNHIKQCNVNCNNDKPEYTIITEYIDKKE